MPSSDIEVIIIHDQDEFENLDREQWAFILEQIEKDLNNE